MSTAQMTGRTSEATLRLKSKLVVIYYLLTILTGAFVLFFHGRVALAVDLIVSVFYIGVTALFYILSK